MKLPAPIAARRQRRAQRALWTRHAAAIYRAALAEPPGEELAAAVAEAVAAGIQPLEAVRAVMTVTSDVPPVHALTLAFMRVIYDPGAAVIVLPVTAERREAACVIARRAAYAAR